MNLIKKLLNFFRKKTPDVSNPVTKYRREAMKGMDSKNWDKMLANLYVLNSLLPKKYNLGFGNREKIKDCAICNHCNEYSKFDFMPDEWICLRCNKKNLKSETGVLSDIMPNGDVRISEPPKDTVFDYDKKMLKWGNNFLYELEQAVNRYRD